ncbi:1-deoxy-D-xylulose-5-phosphate reductoisomerase [Desulfotignum phosphitoxidans]|uniref:1-deoxy-D-xylulose 5-phosphate reductoisomerase n=1 Tax=Desulfotignum phosphitoxidans DSM 13687 TaxID=1286635 RepID=S0G539_9BACT|nr:1-deoxy-D-xylulose-5-phosphate reductoisomerase [Desulfotignum phosphitoxidans]EMS79577.1 1-deoxy-D-xylulose 5-phosphate reductoisomerase Dxr [Desulfotignum phosphitoxidans DSM 13687]
MKLLSILGATGSIGTSALEIVRMHPDRFQVKALTAANNLPLLRRQIQQFMPEMVAVLDEAKARELGDMLPPGVRPEILSGASGYAAAAAWDKVDTVVLAMVGAAGLNPALAAIEAGKDIALANKETLVMAGDIVMAKAREKNVTVLPVDSEHSAMFQCMLGNQARDVKQLFLTASGGPFRNTPQSDFPGITREDALNHPNWSMGNKISIDSATLMNKGLELIEAVHLFGISHQNIQVLIHPQSIVHSMVGFADGSVMAQMGVPDMKQAISFALSFPDRLDTGLSFPDFAALASLTFCAPDSERFPSLAFAREACEKKGTLPAVMNAANEVAVQAFLDRRIRFSDIFTLVSTTMAAHTCIDNPDLSGIIEADRWAREKAGSLI